jgi:hypothetical protein
MEGGRGWSGCNHRSDYEETWLHDQIKIKS